MQCSYGRIVWLSVRTLPLKLVNVLSTQRHNHKDVTVMFMPLVPSCGCENSKIALAKIFRDNGTLSYILTPTVSVNMYTFGEWAGS